MRYLWVDTICIPTPEIGESYKREDVHQREIMPDIYRGSYVTIVATGRDAQIGLYGVQDTKRLPQVRENYSGRTLAIQKPCFEDSVGAWPWSERRWTFQEAHQPRRLLIFSDEQVFFRCHSGVLTESVHMEVPDNERGHVKHRPVDDVWLDKGKPGLGDAFISYTQHALKFSSSESSRPSDNVDAFRSYIPVIGPLFHGLPTSPACTFTIALWFEVFDGLRATSERVQVPSWSWLAWKVRDDALYGDWISPDTVLETSSENTFCRFWRFEARTNSTFPGKRNLVPVDPNYHIPVETCGINMEALTEKETDLAVVAWEVDVLKLQFLNWLEDQCLGCAALSLFGSPNENIQSQIFHATLDPKLDMSCTAEINAFLLFSNTEGNFLLLVKTNDKGISGRVGACYISETQWGENNLTFHMRKDTLVLI
ncbi:uncharacterized protein BDW47DRAFT_83292 [Aspergillus candidus]|uniref:Heterokaryon incompatibility domain-containing protein n=1 Tax=Aspergillus candidus TaxID=41067 RepID=A0A2I2FJQ8_ASPCN|nr:hypothetical protein BDW47DRAFT_83292 [Aspergillus candidus]PLB40875.1 hypothetical protein BDW47DRAFT_83292 [Aspergillus candidus]